MVTTKDGVKFGKELREKEFLFSKGHLNLNHGMYGFSHLCCNLVLDAAYTLSIEYCPDIQSLKTNRLIWHLPSRRPR